MTIMQYNLQLLPLPLPEATTTCQLRTTPNYACGREQRAHILKEQ